MILWKSGTISPRRASFRYRVGLPALYLERLGVRSRFRSGIRFLAFRETRAVVISKPSDTADIAIARMARRRRIPIVLDLCDNVFAEPYAVRARIVVDQIARLASLIVTTTPALAEVVANRLTRPPRIVSIPDPVENLEDTRSLCERVRLLELAEAWERRTTRTSIALRRSVRRYIAKVRQHSVLRLPFVTGRWAVRSISNGVPRWIIGRRRRTASVAASRSVVPATPMDAQTRTIAWFGNHGGETVDFGMLDLLLAAPAIAAVARRHRIRLRVISNSLEKFQRNIAPLPFPTEYFEWHPIRCHEWVRGSDVVIIPNQLNEFSRCKSANRALFALQHGVPVVATRTPALADFDDCIAFDAWQQGIESYLTDPRLREKHLARAAEVIQTRFTPERVARDWLTAIDDAAVRAAHMVDAPAPKPVVVFLVNLIQDLELILPLYRRARSFSSWTPQLWATTSDLFERPEMCKRLEAEGAPYAVVDPRLATRGGFPGWDSVAGLISASESSLEPHAAAHQTTRWAKRHGVRTFTLQHGFENVGLTYSDAEFPIHSVRFASDVVFTWGPLESLHQNVRDDTRRKCVPIGYPKAFESRSRPALDALQGPLVAVFENLHWTRFPEEYRESFLRHFEMVARRMPDVTFLMKPHPAGQWITERRRGTLEFPPNVTIVDSRAREWLDVSAADILRRAVAAVTTPSTIALDAARLQRPVAVAAYGLDLSYYRPLPLLQSADDWGAFVAAAVAARNGDVAERASRFAARVAIEGDAIGRILQVMAEKIGLPPATRS